MELAHKLPCVQVIGRDGGFPTMICRAWRRWQTSNKGEQKKNIVASRGIILPRCQKLTQSGVLMRRAATRTTRFTQLCAQAGLTQEEARSLLEVSERTAYRYANGTVRRPRLAKKVLHEAANKKPASHNTAFRFIDLFAGIGGLRIGFNGIGGHCVFTSEWGRYRPKNLCTQFPRQSPDRRGHTRVLRAPGRHSGT